MRSAAPWYQAQDSPANRARQGLLDDPGQTDAEIALRYRTTPQIAAACRRELASAGDIPGSPALSPADRARAVLLDDASLTNAEAAALAHATVDQVCNVRRALVSYGVLPPSREPARRFPGHVPMPRSPRVLEQGSCVGVIPSPWVSSDPAERTRARLICITECHIAAACLDWALRAVPTSDSAIYAGTGPSERRQLRAERGITRPNATVAINAAKTCCGECGLPLSGPNLISEPGRQPGTVRRRCRRCTQARKHEAYERGKRKAQGEETA